MNGTLYSTSGLRRIIRLNPPVRLRLVGFAAVVTVGAVLITWINSSMGRQMDRLQQEMAAIHSERFYLAVHMRFGIRTLNNTLLRFHLSRQAEDREAFQKEARELRRWIDAKQIHLSTASERETFHELEKSFDQYLSDTERIFKASEMSPERTTFAGIYEQIHEKSRGLLALCEQLLRAQRTAFDSFLGDSQQTLVSLQRLFRISVWLLLGLAAALAILVYRGMIAPLRQEVTESRAIIERQEKLASLGVLAAGVAHEIRNPLTAIKFRLFSLKKSLPPEFAETEDTGVISVEIDRLDRIVKHFLQFARPAEPQRVRVLAGRILEEVRDLMTGELDKLGIELKVEAPMALWIHADPSQLKQVLINLVQNAADSIGRNGTIALRATPETERLDQRNQPVVLLHVVDTGKGISPEVEKRLFDPFFSTKEEGTGLGLAIAARIVEKHGGLLRYRTELSRGTTFEIVLPRIDYHGTETPDYRG